ncbi:hypothetical protein PPTG_01798 [Phytophthora nicotianae INRA-310]|uniref:Uncharacterized protein n=1 Tax=Phytophthora nicotianae (strain INRA-310) TaxID=761204 RepID=W2RAC7_PHYN3|nr:hypothetical protein PPTG_01798 [Phytophthora nicotianae INRA-310]ETN21664.1 hypothetical protein PPTG_01798 [Phytophthora nicotianae INRA-310]
MTAFDVITGKLQRDDITVAAVRDIFDIVLDDYVGKSTVGFSRKIMGQDTLEVIMFLKLNWGLGTLFGRI